jgi:ribosome maturation factor RimP
MKKISTDSIIDVVEPLIVDEGYELIDLEFKNEERGWRLRVFIDKEGGVTLDDCARLSREMGNLLDVEDILPMSYNLEVSSPGLNRPLRKKEHFQSMIGEKIKVKTKLPIENQRNFKAELLKVSDDFILIRNEVKEVEIGFDNIEKANLIYNFR